MNKQTNEVKKLTHKGAQTRNEYMSTLLSTIMSKAKGNPGAAKFMMEASESQYAFGIFLKLEEYPELVGTDLYVLYNDLCGQDLDLVSELLKKCPKDILLDACSRQDYSGRELVKDYLNHSIN